MFSLILVYFKRMVEMVDCAVKEMDSIEKVNLKEILNALI